MPDTQSGSVMAKPPGLRQRGKSWEIRVRVPHRLRSALPTEIVKSFGSLSYRDACRRGWAERAGIERRFEDAEARLVLAEKRPPLSATSFSETQLLDIARRYLSEPEANAPSIPLDERAQNDLRDGLSEEAHQLGQPHALDDATLHALAYNFAARQCLDLSAGATRYGFLEAVQEAMIEHNNRLIARLSGETVSSFNPAFSGVEAGSEEPIGTTLGTAIELYINAPERSANSSSSRKMDRSRLGALCGLIGPAKAVSSITKADLRSYVERLIKLPANYTKRFPGLSPDEAIAAGVASGAATLSPVSIKQDVQAVKSFFGWLEKQDLIEKSPAQHLEAPRASTKSQRRPFEPAEMRALLLATSASGTGRRDWTYWSVRIAMLQGFRFTEPLGLQVRDLIQQNGIWTFRLRPNGYRTLKTAETARDVPVHPRLIELGILKLREDREADELLIADVPRGEGLAFNAAQKQMGRLVRKHVSDDPNLTFHSLRHSFRDAMRDGGFPRSIEERLGGWKSEGSSAMDGYGRGHQVTSLHHWISQISYHGVDIYWKKIFF